jgi:hypothetical protein
VAGAGRLVKIDGTINGVKYKQVLDKNLFQSANNLRLGVNIYVPMRQ